MPTQRCARLNTPSATPRPQSGGRANGSPSSGVTSPPRSTGRSRHDRCGAHSAYPTPKPTPNAPAGARLRRGASSPSWTHAPSQRPPNGSPNDASSNGPNAKHCTPVRKPLHAATLGRRGPARISNEDGQDSTRDQSGQAVAAWESFSSREALGGQGNQLPSALTAATASSVTRADLSSSAGTSSARDCPLR